jgi:sugar phosphate isomerase/epimerase
MPQIIEGCVRHGIRGIAPWRDQVAEFGLEQTARLIRTHDLTVTCLCRGGLFTTKSWLEYNRQAIGEAHVLGAQCVVLETGGLAEESKNLASARQQVSDAIETILPEALDAGVPLAIEPAHPMQAATRACINTLEQALDLCDYLGDGVGVMVDAYQVWWDPKLEAQIKRAGKRILGYQISDWLVPTRDLLNDRGMMGDGVIDLPRLRSWIEAAGYTGFHEAEILSELDWGKKSADQVLTVMKQRHRDCS